ncbi:30S ribosomal protein S10 [Pseudomonas sp. NCHU5208]|uniref:30S ribosomal protein S10 n=1 Tax=unclassified Pseudomonas TaxID=196821 RepID=UPI003F955FAC
MFSEAKSVRTWDLADPKSMRSDFSSESFFIVIDGMQYLPVRQAAETIKTALLRFHGVKVKGPLACPTQRRRHLILREAKNPDASRMYCPNAKRVRNVLLVMNPTSDAIASLIALSMPSTVNIQIDTQQDAFDLKSDV